MATPPGLARTSTDAIPIVSDAFLAPVADEGSQGKSQEHRATSSPTPKHDRRATPISVTTDAHSMLIYFAEEVEFEYNCDSRHDIGTQAMAMETVDAHAQTTSTQTASSHTSTVPSPAVGNCSSPYSAPSCPPCRNRPRCMHAGPCTTHVAHWFAC